MSSGVVLQLAAYGNNDVYISGNPEISLFKNVFKRHTYFGMHDIVNPFSGDPALGQLHKVIINKSGDLLSNMYLNLTVTIKEENGIDYSFIKNLGYNIIEYVELFIGQNKIDKQYGEWMEISKQFEKNDMDESYKHLIEAPNNLLNMTKGSSNTPTHSVELFIPLRFWFCKYPNSPLPLLALQYEEIYLNIKFREAKYLVNRGFAFDSSVSTSLIPTLNSNSCNLITNQIWLHNDEREYFVRNELTYLIEQIQENRDNNIIKTDQETVNSFKLIFNHPVKALFWVINQDKYTNLTEKSNYQFNQEQLFHFLLDLMLTAQNASDTLAANVRHILQITSASDGTLKIINKETNATIHTLINVFRLEHELTEQHTIRNSINILNRALKKIEILSNGLSVHQLDIHNNFHQTGDFTSDEYLLLNKLIHNSTTDLDDVTSTNSIFTTHNKLSNNTSNKPNNLIRYINHNFNSYSLYPGSEINPTKSAKLIFNGLARTERLSGKYFNFLQPLKHELNSPSIGINMYSFALKPFNYQPTGHCNFSKIDNVDLEITQNKRVTNGKVNIYALNYNLLKIKNGVSGLAYSS